jgi:hypothetical protein
VSQSGEKIKGMGKGLSPGEEKKKEREGNMSREERKRERKRNFDFETGRIFRYRICATIRVSDLFSLLII